MLHIPQNDNSSKVFVLRHIKSDIGHATFGTDTPVAVYMLSFKIAHKGIIHRGDNRVVFVFIYSGSWVDGLK